MSTRTPKTTDRCPTCGRCLSGRPDPDRVCCAHLVQGVLFARTAVRSTRARRAPDHDGGEQR